MDKSLYKNQFYTQYKENLGLSVYSCGSEKCQPGHTWGPGMRDYYLIHLVVAGKGTIECGGERYTAEAGQAFIFFPSTLVKYYADQEQPWEYLWVGFLGADAPRMAEASGFSVKQPVVDIPHLEQARQDVLDIYYAKGNSVADEMKMCGRLYLFLAGLASCYDRVRHADSQLSYLEKAIRFVHQNHSESIGVSEIAAAAGISRSHLYRIFIEHCDIAPSGFLASYRINQACSLFREHGVSVSEAAYSVGFIDQLYFSRVFKRIKGIPPSKYLEQLKNGVS